MDIYIIPTHDQWLLLKHKKKDMSEVYTVHNNVQYYHKVKEHPPYSLCWSKGSTRLLVLMILMMMPAASCVQITHSIAWDIKTTVCLLQVHHPRCVFVQMRVGGSVKTQLPYDRDLLVWRWLHVSAVLGHLQVISSFTMNNTKEKTYTLDKILLRDIVY